MHDTDVGHDVSPFCNLQLPVRELHTYHILGVCVAMDTLEILSCRPNKALQSVSTKLSGVPRLVTFSRQR